MQNSTSGFEDSLWISYISTDKISREHTYDIFPNGAKAAFMSSVVISGLRSPTKTWKWPKKKNTVKHRMTDKCSPSTKVKTTRRTRRPHHDFYLLLVSFFWLVGVVAQFTLTSWKRDRCRKRGREKTWDMQRACGRKEGCFSLIRGFFTPLLLRPYLVIENFFSFFLKQDDLCMTLLGS